MSPHPHLFRRTGRHLVAPTHLQLIAAPDLVRHVHDAFSEPGSELVVDLSRVDRLDARMVRPLLWAHEHAGVQQGQLTIIPPRARA